MEENREQELQQFQMISHLVKDWYQQNLSFFEEFCSEFFQKESKGDSGEFYLYTRIVYRQLTVEIFVQTPEFAPFSYIAIDVREWTGKELEIVYFWGDEYKILGPKEVNQELAKVMDLLGVAI